MVSVQTTGGLGRRMEVAVPAARVQEEMEQRLRKIARTVRLDGFRPGKAPFSVIRQRFGSQVHSEIVNDLVQKSFIEAVTEQKLQPAGGPRIEPINTLAGQDLRYAAVFEVYPEIQLQGLDKLAVERPVTEVTDADVEAMVEQLRKQLSDQLAEWKKKKAEAAQQDPAVKETSEASEGSEEAKADDPEMGPLTDQEFFEAYGVAEGGFPELKRRIADNMRREVEQTLKIQVRSQILDALLKANPLELPKALVDSQISDMQMDYAHRTGAKEISQIPPREKFEEAARRRVALGLLINEIIKSEKIEADRTKVQERLQGLVAHAPNPQEALRNYQQNADALHHVEALVLEDQVVDWLLSKAKVVERHQSFKDFTQSGS